MYVGGHVLGVIAYIASHMPGWDRDKVARGAPLYGLPSLIVVDVARLRQTSVRGAYMSFVQSTSHRILLVCVCIVSIRQRTMKVAY
jgi:hypothetical protein